MSISLEERSGDAGTFGDPLTLRDLLDDPALGAAEVLRESLDLGRKVWWCLPWDQAFATERLDGMAVFTPADALTVDGATRHLEELERRDASCVLVHGDARRAGGGVLEAAGSVPVIQLPATASYLDVSRAVAERTLAQETRMLEYGVTVHRTLGELLYQGAGLPALARQLSRLSRCPAYILDCQGKILAYEQSRAGPGVDRTEVVRLLCQTGAVASTVSEGDDAGADPEVVQLALEAGEVTCVLTPIVLGRVRYGWIVLVESAPPVSHQERDEHQVIAEQAVTIVGSEMLRLHSVEEAEERARGDFVHALLHGRFANRGDLLARASHHDFAVDASYGVVVARGFQTARVGEALDHMHLARLAQRVLPRRNVGTFTAVLGDILVVIRQVLVQPVRGTAPADGNAQIAQYAKALCDELSGRLGYTVNVTYGRPASDAFSIPSSYREARVALGVCERLGLEQVSGYPELRVFGILADIATTDEGRSFAQEVLAPLRKREGESGQLDRAVIAYVEAGGNLNAAARRLNLHRNTMLHKLERASRVLRMDLRQAESRFTVWLAYRINLLDQAQSAVEKEFKPGT